jgi:predicted nucleotidyltransferase
MPLPELHRTFLDTALPRLQADSRLVGMAVGGSYHTGRFDEYSDLDLVIVVNPTDYERVMLERMGIAERLGALLAAFTGEHVGEPRLIICLYGPPLLHVDLKFVMPADLAQRIEDPTILWEIDDVLTEAMRTRPADYPQPDLQWIEDRFWVWLHYLACKVGRGELFEVIDGLNFLRVRVLGPLALVKHGYHPRGVRQLEQDAAPELPLFVKTLCGHDVRECVQAIRAVVELYQSLRETSAASPLVRRVDAERETLRYFDEVSAKIGL